MSDRSIVYIRATDQRPLYIQIKGKLYRIVAYYSPNMEGEWVECKPYYLREGDRVKVYSVNPLNGLTYSPYVEIDKNSWFTDNPKLSSLKYPSA